MSTELRARFFALLETHGYYLTDKLCEDERVPHGTRHVGTVWITPKGEVVVTDGSPADTEDDDPNAHNCDEMGCSTVSHVIARVPLTTEPSEP